MSTLGAGLALAGLAAVGVNAGYVVQHAALAGVGPLAGRGTGQTLRALVRSRRWLTGAALGYGGLGAQLLALALAPACLVQSVLAAGLVVALAGWALQGQAGPPARQLLAVLMLAGGLAAVAAGVAPGRPDVVPLTALAAFAAACLAAVTAVSQRPRTRGPVTEAVLAGVLYGVTTTAMATSAAVLPGSPVLAAAVLLAGGGCAVAALPRFQRALQALRPARAVLLMSAAMNATALTGALVLAGPGTVAPAAVGGLLALAGAGIVAAGPASAAPAEATARPHVARRASRLTRR